MTTAIGLRDRKKAATRTALSEAAVRLASLHGLESVTAEAIAAEAGVSTRTFHNYFPSKEDAVLHRLDRSVQEWVELLQARPEDEPIWDSLEQLAIGIVSDSGRDLEELRAVPRLIEESPALMAKKLRMHNDVSRIFGAAIADRTGTNVDTDLYPNLLAMVAGAAVKAALELSIANPERSPVELTAEAFAALRRGLPQPVAR